jgi:hypothetical protein
MRTTGTASMQMSVSDMRMMNAQETEATVKQQKYS